MSRWWTLIRERFPPGATLPMVFAFVLANALVAGRALDLDVAPARVVAAAVLALSFLFRLRLFDELKDHEVDRVMNPERPLARGLLSSREVRRVAVALAALEIVLAAALGLGAFVAHALAVAYSGLMYREFFIGERLRPHLTTYAVMHTLVSGLLGWSIAAAVGGRAPWELPAPVLAFGLVNWALFNVFEFARKTYAPGEERARVESYSKVFGPAGAGCLTISQILGSLAVLALAGTDIVGPRALPWEAAIAAVPVGAAVTYGIRQEIRAARILRAVSGAWVVLFFAVVAAASSVKGG